MLGLSQSDLARMAGISVPTVKRAESDIANTPNVAEETRERIEVVLQQAGIEFANGDTPGVRLKRKSRR